MMKMKKKPITVVHAKCCTDCVLDHMKVAVCNKKERQVLARFQEADGRFCHAKYEYRHGIFLLKEYSKVLFTGKDLSNIEALINELDILSYGLPDDMCFPF